jgi:hypothetical protein
MGLGAAILHCQYTEISINYMGLGAFYIVNMQKSRIIVWV